MRPLPALAPQTEICRPLSLIEYYVRRGRLVRCGLDPDRVYRDALAEIGVGPAPGVVPIGADVP